MTTSTIIPALEATYKESVLDVMKAIVLPRRNFVGDSVAYDLEKYQGDAIDYKNLVVSVILWAKNNLEFDRFSRQVTEDLIKYQVATNSHVWDYCIEDFLEQNSYSTDEYELLSSGYTYNDGGDYNRLDRDVHYTMFKYDGDYYIAFSVHHGADARAGFSDTIVLKCQDDMSLFLATEIQAYIGDEDYSWSDLEDIATYCADDNEWYHNETGEAVSIYSGANGF